MPPESAPLRSYSSRPAEAAPDAEPLPRDIQKAMQDSEYTLYERGIAYPPTVDPSKVEAFPFTVREALQKLATQCADYLKRDAFSDKYGADHNGRTEWRERLEPNVKQFFRGTRFSGNLIAAVVSAANQVRYPLERAIRDKVFDPGQSAETAAIIEKVRAIPAIATQDFGARYNAANSDEKYVQVQRVSRLAREYLEAVT